MTSATTKRRSRRVVIIATAVVLIIVGTAAALFVARARVDGSLRSGSFVPEWTAASVQNGAGTTTSGASATVTNGLLTLDSGVAFPGDTVTVGGDVRIKPNGNATSGKITGFSIANLPSGWKAELTSGCGATVNSGVGASVTFRITMTDTASADGATTVIAPQSGVEMQPLAQAPASPTCPAQIAP